MSEDADQIRDAAAEAQISEHAVRETDAPAHEAAHYAVSE